MDKITCEYCGTKQEKKERCGKCGAPVSVDIVETLDPFYYRGYMIWPERFPVSLKIRYHVWLGDRRVYSIDVNFRWIYEIVPEGEEIMPYVWDLIKLVLGEKETLEYERQNEVVPVVFEIKRSELWEKAINV